MTAKPKQMPRPWVFRELFERVKQAQAEGRLKYGGSFNRPMQNGYGDWFVRVCIDGGNPEFLERCDNPEQFDAEFMEEA